MKKTARKRLLIIIFCCILVVLISYVFSHQVKQIPLQTGQHATLKMYPNPATMNSDGTITVNVSLNPHSEIISGFHVELSYDPAVLDFVSIEPDELFINAQEYMEKIDKTT